MTRRGPLCLSLLTAVCVSACSGEPFRLADAEGSGGDGGGQSREFPPLVPTTGNGVEAGAPVAREPDAGSSGDGNTPDAEPPAPPEPPPPGPCGVLRTENPDLADAETCIPASTFNMGSTSGTVPAGYTAHAPAHSVILASYILDVYEVTVARYRACVTAGVCAAPGNNLGQGCTYTTQPVERELYPVTCVNWESADTFCGWDGGRRLPTEAEWERAARGASGTTFPWGDTFNCSRAVLGGGGQCTQHAGQSPTTVGSLPTGQSEEGVFDLAGNAWEWVADWSGPYTSASAENPTGPASGSARIQRGGGWQTTAADATGYVRRAEAPAATSPSSFRCARDAAP